MAAQKRTTSTEAPSGAEKFKLALSESSEKRCEFTASLGLYEISAGATADDVYNQLSARLAQLVGMAVLFSGGGEENFRELSEENQDSYLWAVASMARECKQLLSVLSPVFPMHKRH